MASREEIEAYKRFCEKATTERLYPSEVIQLATRGIILADALTAAEEERDRALKAVENLHITLGAFARFVEREIDHGRMDAGRSYLKDAWQVLDETRSLHTTETEGSDEKS